MSYEEFKKKMESKQAVVGVIGLGYVGLPLAVAFAEAGYRVVGFDIDTTKIDSLLKGESYVLDVESEKIKEVLDKENFLPTSDFSKIRDVDSISICVPTPLRKTKEPDISYVINAVSEIKRYFHRDLLIILESTVYPGTTEEIIKTELEKIGYKGGEDFYLCFSPERIDPGNKKYALKNTPKVIGSITKKSSKLAYLLYSKIAETIVIVSSPRVAETVKLLENVFRAVNIACVNELAMMCERMGIDIWEVIEAASTKPFGFMPFYPGPGIGGHCIPLDPQYLAWKAKAYNFYSRFIELASDINANMPRYVVAKIIEVLNSYKKCINDSHVLILGVAYKKDVNDIRESPSLEIYKMLKEYGAIVEYNDPYVKEFRDEKGDVIRSVILDYNNLRKYEYVVLCTDHSCYDYAEIAKRAELIIDTRNAFKGIESKNIYKLGTPVY